MEGWGLRWFFSLFLLVVLLLSGDDGLEKVQTKLSTAFQSSNERRRGIIGARGITHEGGFG